MIDVAYQRFDGNPGEAGPCYFDDEPLYTRGHSLETISRRLLANARRDARGCGAYPTGYEIFLLIWADDGCHQYSTFI